MADDEAPDLSAKQLKALELRLREHAEDIFREKYYGQVKDEVSSNMMSWLRSRYSFMLLFVGIVGFSGTALLIQNLTASTVREELVENKDTIDEILKESAKLDGRIEEINRAIARLQTLSDDIEAKLAAASATSAEIEDKLAEAGKLANTLKVDLDGLKTDLASSETELADLITVTALDIERRIEKKMAENAKGVDDLIAAKTLEFESRMQNR